MIKRRLLVLSGIIPAFALSICAPRARAAGFAIAATDVTMPASGIGVSQFSITGIPVAGTIALNCAYSGPTTTARLPVCPLTPPVAYQVTANGALTGSIAFYPYGVAVPAGLNMRLIRPAGRLLGGVLLLGLGFRRKRLGWPALAMFIFASLSGLAGMSACTGAQGNGMTPGIYVYTITAANSPSVGAGPTFEASTMINVTVP